MCVMKLDFLGAECEISDFNCHRDVVRRNCGVGLSGTEYGLKWYVQRIDDVIVMI